MKMDSGLSAYCHGNVDFSNVAIWSDADQPVLSLYTKGLSPLCDTTLLQSWHVHNNNDIHNNNSYSKCSTP